MCIFGVLHSALKAAEATIKTNVEMAGWLGFNRTFITTELY